MELERVQQLTPFTLQKQWYESGVAVDPGTVTVGITRADGTELVAAGTSTSGSGTAVRSFNLTTTHTALLDRLTVTWTSTSKGTLTDTVEIVGGFLFSIAEFQTLLPSTKASATITVAQIAAARTLAEQALEDACAVAFVPRYELETLDGFATGLLLTKWPRITAVRTVTLDTATVTASDVTALRYGALYYTAWTTGYANVTVGYEHGHTTPPERVRRAAMLLAKQWILNSPIDDRATSISNDDGTFALMTPGIRGVMFGLPEVEATIQQYALSVGVA